MPKLPKLIKLASLLDKIDKETTPSSPTTSETIGEVIDHVKTHYNPIKKLERLKHDHDIKTKREKEKALRHHEEGYINRNSLKPGDIFINHTKDSFGEHILHNMAHKLLDKGTKIIKNPKIKIPATTVQSPAFGHGGIIISDTHYISTGITGQGPLKLDLISKNFNSKKEYHVFRPASTPLAEKIVGITLDLYWNNYTPLMSEATPQQPMYLVGFLQQARMCEGSRALLKSYSMTNKDPIAIRTAYEAMLENAPDLQDWIEWRKRDLSYNATFLRTDSKSNVDQPLVDKDMETYLSTLTATGVNLQQFTSTEFIAFVVHAANGVSNKRGLAKLSERQLVELVRQHTFTEYKSEEANHTDTQKAKKATIASPITGLAATAEETKKVNNQKATVLTMARQVARQAETEAKRAEAEVTRVRREVEKAKAEAARAVEQLSTLTIKTMEETPKSSPGNIKNWVLKKFTSGPTKASRLESERAIAERNQAMARETETRMSAMEQLVVEEAIKARATAIIAKNEEIEINKRYPYISTNTLLYKALTPPKQPKILKLPAPLLVAAAKPAPLSSPVVDTFEKKFVPPLPGVQPKNPFGKEQAPPPPTGKPPIYPTALNPFEKRQAPPPPTGKPPRH